MPYIATEGVSAAERQFRRWEDLLAQILKNWPQPTVVAAQPGQRQRTLENRIRWAISFCLHHRVETKFDLRLLKSIRNNLIVSASKEPGHVWIGPRGAAGQAVTLGLLGQLTPAALKDLLAFVSHGICAPITVSTQLNVPQIARDFDVSVEQLGPNQYRIVA